MTFTSSSTVKGKKDRVAGIGEARLKVRLLGLSKSNDVWALKSPDFKRPTWNWYFEKCVIRSISTLLPGIFSYLVTLIEESKSCIEPKAILYFCPFCGPPEHSLVICVLDSQCPIELEYGQNSNELWGRIRSLIYVAL